MKPFHGGQLLDASQSPFKVALSKEQCIQYALDRPAVMTVVPGVRNLKDFEQLLKFIDASEEEKDYSVISQFTPAKALGNCAYSNHCLPCPKGIDIGLVNKYYDLAIHGDELAHNHYYKLSVNADNCIKCYHCNNRCPFKVDQVSRMVTISEYFKK